MSCNKAVKTMPSQWSKIKNYIAGNKFLTFVLIVMLVCEGLNITSMGTIYFWITCLFMISIESRYESSTIQLLNKLDDLKLDIYDVRNSLVHLQNKVDSAENELSKQIFESRFQSMQKNR